VTPPVDAFEPSEYPGPRPAGPVLVRDGRVHDVEVVAGDAGPVLRAGVDASVLSPSAVRWVVAYGSNASPSRLVGKGLDARGAVLLPASVAGWVPAFEHRRTGYGAVPLTFVPRAGVRTTTWLLGVHVADTRRLDRSEGRRPRDAAGAEDPADAPADVRATGPPPDDLHTAPADAYRLGRIGDVDVAGGWRVDDALAYLPGSRTEVQVDAAGRWRTWPAVGQPSAAAHVDADGPSRPAPAPADPVRGPWPHTPLRRVGA
jgi:hypothetical protein